jgi:hypothetical protein
MERQYTKIGCALCGDHIEFPVDNAGEMICCPHCGGKITLQVPNVKETLSLATAPTPPKPASRFSGCLGCLGFLVVLFIIGQLLAWIFGWKEAPPAKSPGVSYYEKELKDGIKAYDPNHQLTPQDERMIRSTAEELNKSNPK